MRIRRKGVTMLKNERDLKVYGMSGHNYKSVPTIMLKGKWLQEFGFEIGDKFHVSCEQGKLVITMPEDE